jgi:outer membrane receptor protein involved in Fe transport
LLSFAANFNNTEVTRRTNRQSDPANPNPVYFLGDRDVFLLENGAPDFRANFTARHSWSNNVSASLRGNWYGDHEFTNGSLSQFQDMSGDVYWDLDVTWDVRDALSVTLGGRNIFDAAPDPQPSFWSCCGMTAHESSVMDWQGPYYYIRGVFNWN